MGGPNIRMEELIKKAEKFLKIHPFLRVEGATVFSLEVGKQVKGPIFKLEEKVTGRVAVRLHVVLVQGFLALAIEPKGENEEFIQIYKGPITRISRLSRVLKELTIELVKGE